MSRVTYGGGGDNSGYCVAQYFFDAVGLAVDTPFFVADRTYVVASIQLRLEVAGSAGGAVTCQIRKAPSGTAIASGTLLHSGTGNLKGTAATNQTLTLSTVDSDVNIPSGTCIGFDLTGVSTAAKGCVTVLLIPKG